MNWSKLPLRLFLFLGVVLLLTFLLAACGEEEKPGATPTPGGEVTQPSGPQELHLNLLSGEPKTLDPNRASFAVEITVIKQLFRGLLWFDKDLNVMPMAAKEVPTVENGGISRDGLTYTFKLRDNLKWSDGQPLTAKDFEYSVKRLLDPTVAADYAAFYYGIKGAQEYNTSKETDATRLSQLRDLVGVKAQDEKTIVFTLKQPQPTFLQLAALWPIFPVRQDVIERHGDRWVEAGNLIGNGPFMLQEWAHQDHITLVPNPNWWGDTKPKLTKITMRMITDRIQAYNAYIAGEIDMVDVPPEQTDAVRNDARLSRENVLHTELVTFAWQYNNKQPPFDNKTVRQAFSMAVDRDALLNAVFRGIGQVAYSWIPPGMPGHDAELGKEYKLNPERAKQLLSQAGFPEGRGLPKITFTFANVGANPLVAQFTQEQFKRNLGIDIDLEPLEPRAFSERILNEQFQLALLGWGTDYPDPENWLPQLFGCSQRDAAGKCTQFAGNNHSQYDNPEFDRLMEQAARELDPKKALDIYARAQKMVVDDAAVIFMRYRARNLLIKPYVKGLIRTGLDGEEVGDWFFEQVFISRG